MSLKPQTVRVFCDAARKEQPLDLNAGSETPKVWNGANARFEIGLGFNDAIVTDIANVSALRLQIFESQTTENAALVSAILNSGDLNQALTQENWDDDSN